MSLDVYLMSNIDQELKEWSQRKQKSIDEAGKMIGLIPAIEGYYEGRKPESEEIYSANITHNLGEMANMAGIYYYLWRPDELNITTAKELIEPLEVGLKKLKENPEYYKKFDAPNGWGTYEHFVSFVENYLKACMENPDAKIEVSR